MFEFSFTAPGDDGDIGQAMAYEIILMSNSIALLYHDNPDYKKPKDFIVPQGELLNFELNSNFVPKVYGEKEIFKIKVHLNKSIDLIALKVRARDKNGNIGEWSPVVTIKLNNKYSLAHGILNFDRDKQKPRKLIMNHDPKNLLNRKTNISITLISIFIALVVVFLVPCIIIIKKYDCKKRKYSARI